MMKWLASKTCWLDEIGRELTSGCRRCSRTLTARQREMVRLLVPNQLIYRV